MSTSTIYLPLNVQQLVDLLKQLPKKQKQQLVNLLLEEDGTISEQQKQLVRSRIKKYKSMPDKLIKEKDAWNSVHPNQNQTNRLKNLSSFCAYNADRFYNSDRCNNLLLAGIVFGRH